MHHEPEKQPPRGSRLGRTAFVILYGVCGWGLLTGLLWGIAMSVLLCLPAYLIMTAFGHDWSHSGPWLLFSLPLILGVPGFMLGGIQWGQLVWDGRHRPLPRN